MLVVAIYATLKGEQMAKVYNTAKLKGRIVEIYGTQVAFAEAIGARPETVSATMSGKRELTQSEIEKWADALRIAPDNYQPYFFAH